MKKRLRAIFRRRSIKQPLREFVRSYPFPVLIGTMGLLSVIQTLTSDTSYTKFSIAATFFVFSFKSWVNFVFSITTHRQHGETDLSRSMERYFWSLLSQSLAFSVIFIIAFVDAMDWQFFGTNWTFVRNITRNIGITTIVAVIIFGDAALEDLMAYIKRGVGAIEDKDQRDLRQNRREGKQNQREEFQNVVEKEWRDEVSSDR